MAKKLRNRTESIEDDTDREEVMVTEEVSTPPTHVDAAEHAKNMAEVCSILDGTERQGMAKDQPKGVRWIVMSDTLARKLVMRLKA